jgi:hypothetical protein
MSESLSLLGDADVLVLDTGGGRDLPELDQVFLQLLLDLHFVLDLPQPRLAVGVVVVRDLGLRSAAPTMNLFWKIMRFMKVFSPGPPEKKSLK